MPPNIPLTHLLFVITGKTGKTLDLLKSKSKPIAAEKKRKKVPLLGSFETYQESKKKSQLPTGMAQPPNTQNLAQGAQQLLNFGAANSTQKGPAKPNKDANMNAK